MEQTTVTGTGSTAPVQTSEEHKSNVLYLVRLESQVGKTIPRELVPSDRRLSENELNKLYFDWYNGGATGAVAPRPEATGPYEFTAEELNMFKYTMTLKGSSAYQSMEQSMNTSLTAANDHMRQFNAYMKSAADYREKLMLMDNTKEMDLTEQIKTIAQSGWYTYSPELTRSHNSRYGQGTDMAIIFVTPNVVCRYFNPKSQTDMAVEMGMFKVIYKPKRNQLLAQPYDNNLNVSGYPHPHVSGSEGSVCWGNAAEMHKNAMVACTPVDSFRALQIILQTYNPDSPYQTLSSFDDARKRIQLVRSGASVAFTGESCTFDGGHYECRGAFDFNLVDFPIDLRNEDEILVGDEIERWEDETEDDGTHFFVKCKVWERINSNGQRSGYTYVRQYDSSYSGNFRMERIYL